MHARSLEIIAQYALAHTKLHTIMHSSGRGADGGESGVKRVWVQNEGHWCLKM